MEEPFFWCELGEIIAVDKIKIIAADMHSEDALKEVGKIFKKEDLEKIDTYIGIYNTPCMIDNTGNIVEGFTHFKVEIMKKFTTIKRIL